MGVRPEDPTGGGLPEARFPLKNTLVSGRISKALIRSAVVDCLGKQSKGRTKYTVIRNATAVFSVFLFSQAHVSIGFRRIMRRLSGTRVNIVES